MKYCDKITFVLFAFNEEARIERAVRNFVGTARVLVVDNYSTDRTVELATAAGAKVLMNKNQGWCEDEATVEKIKSNVETPWLYWGSTDEIVGADALEQIYVAIESGKYKIVSIIRKNYYYGVFCHNAYSDRSHRIFEKGAIDFKDNKVHHFGVNVVPDNQICALPEKYFVHHFISNTAKSYLRSMDGYSDIEGTRNSDQSSLKFIARMVKTFMVNYFLKGGRRAGRAGLFLGLQMSYYQALAMMKTYEHLNQVTTPTIENGNNRTRDQLLREIDGAQRMHARTR